MLYMVKNITLYKMTLENNDEIEEMLKNWIAKKYSPFITNTIQDTIEMHDKFASFTEFVDHAINLNLVWWGKKPSRILEMMGDTVVTPEQIKFMTDFQEGKFKQEVNTQVGIEKENEVFLEIMPDSIKTIKSIMSSNNTSTIQYDDYPLLFRFYSRLLPAQLSLLVLASNISKEKPYLELEEFQNDSYEIVSKMADKIRKSELTKRNQKISTGMPLSETKINEAVTKKQKIEAIKKIASSESKFKNQYVGRLRKDKDSGKEFFEGVLYALDLIVPKKMKINKEEIVCVYLSQKGIDFLKIINPVVNNLKKEQKMTREVFSPEGVKFILHNLIKTKKLDLEYQVCKEIVKKIQIRSNSETISITTAKDLDKIYENVCSDWIERNKELAAQHGIDEIVWSHKNKKKSDKIQTRLQACRVATMGRLSELDVVTWNIDSHSQSTYGLGPNSQLLLDDE